MEDSTGWIGLLFGALLLPLSGCAGQESLAPPDGAMPGAPDGTVEAPEWGVGDWWTYQFGDTTATFVVTQDLGADWLMETTSEEVAFNEAYAQFDPEDDFSMLGPVRKSDLAGSEGSTRVQHLQFPLEPNATWTTSWDGAQRTITANPESETVWVLEAREAGRLAVRYSYDVDVRWFGFMAFFDENETERFRFALRGSGADAVGPVARWTLEEVALVAHEAGPTAQSSTFEVPEDITDVWIRLEGGCNAPGTYAFGVGPPQNAATMMGSGYAAEGTCPDSVDVEESIGKDPPGTWGYALGGTSTDLSFELHVLFRYLELAPVGA